MERKNELLLSSCLLGILLLAIVNSHAEPLREKKYALDNICLEKEVRAAKLEEFTALHRNYQSYDQELQREIDKKSRILPQKPQFTQIMQDLQQLAGKYHIVLQEVKLPEHVAQEKIKLKQGLRVYPLDLVIYGNYFNVVRYLGQLERRQWGICSLEMQGTEQGFVQTDIRLEIYGRG